MPDEPRSGSWWKTLPGVLTAVAGLITAITGLIVALHQIFPGTSTHTSARTAVTADVTTTDTGSQPAADTTAGTGPYRATFPNGVRVAFDGDAVVYKILSTRVERSNPGELTLKLAIRMTNNTSYPANFWDASFRLLVNGVSRAPVSNLDAVVDGHSASEGTVIVDRVPAKAGRVVLVVYGSSSNRVTLPIVLTPTG